MQRRWTYCCQMEIEMIKSSFCLLEREVLIVQLDLIALIWVMLTSSTIQNLRFIKTLASIGTFGFKASGI